MISKGIQPLRWLILLALLAGCGTATPGAETYTSPPDAVSPLATATAAPTSTPVPTPSPTSTSTPLPTPTPALQAIQLVVLHTNDNWGETEPCG